MKSPARIILLFTALFASSCFDENDIGSDQSQSFIKFYNTYPVFTAADVKQINGNGYALLGTITTSTDNTQICLIRTDEFGNSIDSARYYGQNVDGKAYCLQVLSDGGFGILGSMKNQITGRREILLIKTDAQGNPIWTKIIGSTGNIEAKNFKIDAAGSFIMTGYAESSATSTDKQVLVAVVDKDSNSPVWSPRKYGVEGSGKDDEGKHIEILADGNYIITGTTRSYPPGTTISHAFVMIVNTSGGSPGFFPIASNADEEGNCIRVIDDNHFLVLGTVKSASPDSANTIMLKKISLVEFVLNTEWKKTFGSTGNDFGQYLLFDSKSIYLLGTWATASNNTAVSLIITDSSGNNARYSYFGLGTQLSGCTFHRTTDNGFIISATNKHSDNSTSFTLIKTLPDGSL